MLDNALASLIRRDVLGCIWERERTKKDEENGILSYDSRKPDEKIKEFS